MRILKNKEFSRFARRAGITNTDLCHAAAQANQGIIDADLGGGVIKQRIARPGEGKSGGFRVIVLFMMNNLAFLFTALQKTKEAISRPMSGRPSENWLPKCWSMMRRLLGKQSRQEL